MTAEGRHEAALWRGPVSHPAPVMGVIYADLELDATEYAEALAETTARLDDAFWGRFARRAAFTWQGFTHWWVARRFVVPRDIRRR